MALQLDLVPQKAILVRRDKTTVAACWIGAAGLRPYVYPFLGPHDREMTRLGHPLDPVGHSHHKSIWIGHNDVDGVTFWGDSPRAGRIEVTGVEFAREPASSVSLLLRCSWRPPRAAPVLEEERRLTFAELAGGELALDIDTRLRPASKKSKVTLGDTPFGLLGIRVARTLRVAERLGGLIVNSNEAENEAGCFWQHAEWCDYSGPVPLAGPEPAKGDQQSLRPKALPFAIAGIACFDHPANSPRDTFWHTRDDGWMGPCVSKGGAREIAAAGLRLRYRIESHAGRPWDAGVDDRYRKWRREA